VRIAVIAVASIIALLALIVVPVVRNRVASARIVSTQDDMRGIEIAQVIANGDTGSIKTIVEQGVAGKGGIESDIPVVAHKQVGLVGVEILQPGYGEAGGGVFDHTRHISLDDSLQSLHIFNAGELPAQSHPHQRPQRPSQPVAHPLEFQFADGREKFGIIQQSLQDSRHFSVVKRSDVGKVFHY
jgi:hypothetical protein